jgi:hypothetical protein
MEKLVSFNQHNPVSKDRFHLFDCLALAPGVPQAVRGCYHLREAAGHKRCPLVVLLDVKDSLEVDFERYLKIGVSLFLYGSDNR